jgi:hypothetical protein
MTPATTENEYAFLAKYTKDFLVLRRISNSLSYHISASKYLVTKYPLLHYFVNFLNS